MNFTGRSRTLPLRNPRQLVNCFSTRLIRALDETSRFRATTWGRPYGGRTGHPRITNICLASRASLGRAPAKRQRRVPPGGVEPYPYGIRGNWYNVFPLGTSAHWMKRHVSKCGFPRAPTASEHALFCSVFVGATLRGRPFRNVNFTGRSRTLPLRNPRQSVKCFSTRHIRALGQGSALRIKVIFQINYKLYKYIVKQCRK